MSARAESGPQSSTSVQQHGVILKASIVIVKPGEAAVAVEDMEDNSGICVVGDGIACDGTLRAEAETVASTLAERVAVLQRRVGRLRRILDEIRERLRSTRLASITFTGGGAALRIYTLPGTWEPRVAYETVARPTARVLVAPAGIQVEVCGEAGLGEHGRALGDAVAAADRICGGASRLLGVVNMLADRSKIVYDVIARLDGSVEIGDGGEARLEIIEDDGAAHPFLVILDNGYPLGRATVSDTGAAILEVRAQPLPDPVEAASQSARRLAQLLSALGYIVRMNLI